MVVTDTSGDGDGGRSGSYHTILIVIRLSKLNYQNDH